MEKWTKGPSRLNLFRGRNEREGPTGAFFSFFSFLFMVVCAVVRVPIGWDFESVLIVFSFD